MQDSREVGTYLEIMELIGNRVLLRRWSVEDAETLFRYASSEEVGPMAGWPPHQSVEESREIIRTIFSASETYAIVLRESGEVVGSVGLLASGVAHSECVAAGEFELGFWVGRPLWGQGIATEASQVLLQHCFEELGTRRVWASHYDYNHASARVQTKCGFTYHHTETQLHPLSGEAVRVVYNCLEERV